MKILELNENVKNDILSNLLKRSPNSYCEYESRVNAIIEDIKSRRNEAVFERTCLFPYRRGCYPKAPLKFRIFDKIIRHQKCSLQYKLTIFLGR